MKANRCDYVRVLLDGGVKLKIKDFPELYDQVIQGYFHCMKRIDKRRYTLNVDFELSYIPSPLLYRTGHTD